MPQPHACAGSQDIAGEFILANAAAAAALLLLVIAMTHCLFTGKKNAAGFDPTHVHAALCATHTYNSSASINMTTKYFVVLVHKNKHCICVGLETTLLWGKSRTSERGAIDLGRSMSSTVRDCIAAALCCRWEDVCQLRTHRAELGPKGKYSAAEEITFLLIQNTYPIM